MSFFHNEKDAQCATSDIQSTLVSFKIATNFWKSIKESFELQKGEKEHKHGM